MQITFTFTERHFLDAFTLLQDTDMDDLASLETYCRQCPLAAAIIDAGYGPKNRSDDPVRVHDHGIETPHGDFRHTKETGEILQAFDACVLHYQAGHIVDVGSVVASLKLPKTITLDNDLPELELF